MTLPSSLPPLAFDHAKIIHDALNLPEHGGDSALLGRIPANSSPQFFFFRIWKKKRDKSAEMGRGGAQSFFTKKKAPHTSPRLFHVGIRQHLNKLFFNLNARVGARLWYAMTILPRAELDRIIRKAGAERVGLDASDAMAEILEDRAKAIVERALAIARHARGNCRKKRNGRRHRVPPVLRREDILLAVS